MIISNVVNDFFASVAEVISKIRLVSHPYIKQMKVTAKARKVLRQKQRVGLFLRAVYGPQAHKVGLAEEGPLVHRISSLKNIHPTIPWHCIKLLFKCVSVS